ncbi:MAG: hypothetical protein KKE39_11690 [Bacteroidetes bacterium]|nr:hypothetical protein [Bacteroidota bacterium]MBU1372823.1 hypothetical protein [Bacteroidota bacterium]MBU1485552.1 hypothetical protein [Bacteroidota bacterium]MBU1760558.1 hypothetical protein [Bacteroidota bacterium]MBU2267920.1 hypothetical protein [Bacteroidota bacterium]
MLKVIFIAFFVLAFADLKAQEYQFIAKIDTVAKIATVDNFGNVFVITLKNEVLKFNPKGKFLWNYTNNNFGEITQLDVTDPLRVILYYAAYQQIVVLNNNLSEISKFSFSRNPDVQISLIASANNNGFWAYDQINRELIKLTNYFADDIKSGNIYQRDGLNLQVDFMLTDDQNVYLNDTLEGIRIFDQYGNFIKSAVIYPKKGFEVDGNLIYYFDEGKLMSYNTLSFALKEVLLPKKGNISNVLLRYRRLLILGEKDLTLWAVKNN